MKTDDTNSSYTLVDDSKSSAVTPNPSILATLESVQSDSIEATDKIRSTILAMYYSGMDSLAHHKLTTKQKADALQSVRFVVVLLKHLKTIIWNIPKAKCMTASQSIASIIMHAHTAWIQYASEHEDDIDDHQKHCVGYNMCRVAISRALGPVVDALGSDTGPVLDMIRNAIITSIELCGPPLRKSKDDIPTISAGRTWAKCGNELLPMYVKICAQYSGVSFPLADSFIKYTESVIAELKKGSSNDAPAEAKTQTRRERLKDVVKNMF